MVLKNRNPCKFLTNRDLFGLLTKKRHCLFGDVFVKDIAYSAMSLFGLLTKKDIAYSAMSLFGLLTKKTLPIRRCLLFGVPGRARTDDIQNHNLTL